MFLNGVPGVISERRPDDTLVVSHCGELGLGVRTLVPVRRGAILDYFHGSVGPELRQHSLQIGHDQHIYDTRFIGYLSHSCDPNCELDVTQFALVALRDLEEGSLLMIDYAVTEDRLYRQFACLCGADNCRKWVRGRSQEISAEGSRYLSESALRAPSE